MLKTFSGQGDNDWETGQRVSLGWYTGVCWPHGHALFNKNSLSHTGFVGFSLCYSLIQSILLKRSVLDQEGKTHSFSRSF